MASRTKLSRKLRDLRDLATEKAGELGELLDAADEEGDEPPARVAIERRLTEAKRRLRGGLRRQYSFPGERAVVRLAAHHDPVRRTPPRSARVPRPTSGHDAAGRFARAPGPLGAVHRGWGD